MSTDLKLTLDKDEALVDNSKYRCMKQMALAISTTKAEYVAEGRAYQQALWMKQAMKDYDIHCEGVKALNSHS
ncbi:hypothetical protein Tco_1071546 [Tanacetum coccineum]